MTVKSVDTFVLKQGIRLPKSSEQWTEANNYFRSIFANIIFQEDMMDETIKFMNDSIYDFFKATYGTIKSTNQANKNFHTYKDFTVKQLEKELVQLKSQGTNFADITYLFHLLRLRLSNIARSKPVSDTYDRQIGRNFLNFMKQILEKGSSIMPSFSSDHCTSFFLHSFCAILPH